MAFLIMTSWHGNALCIMAPNMSGRIFHLWYVRKRCIKISYVSDLIIAEKVVEFLATAVYMASLSAPPFLLILFIAIHNDVMA